MHHQKNKITINSINSLPWEPQQVELYAQIQAFVIDHPGASFPFNQRLARDHQWSLIYSNRVMEEYKKFLFLAIVADYPVTPSQVVDQAWHLHLTYTHSYWNDLCIHILPRPLHHTPTQGGQQQRELFGDYYSKTLESYERFFGNCAPIDIWPAPATRFRQASQFRQVNSEGYWIIPKPNFDRLQRVFWKISPRPWLRNAMITLLAIGLVFSLNSVYHSAIAVDLDLINCDLIKNQIIQPTVAQVSSTPNSDVPTYSEINLTQNFGWIKQFFKGVITCLNFVFSLGILCLILSIPGLIRSYFDSRCPACKRFWAMKTTTHVLRKATEETEGEQLVTRLCKCCQYTQERHETTPKEIYEPYSHSGCACGI